MNNLRLKSVPFDLDGRTYHLCANMAVLAEVQDVYGGDISAALQDNKLGCMAFLAAMVNDSAEQQGLSERYTAKEISRMLSIREGLALCATVRGLVTASLADPDDEENEKNGEPRQVEAE